MGIACSTFVSVSLKSLKFHKVAYVLAQKNKHQKALAILTKCADLAGKMAEESDKLVKKADALVQLSFGALLQANDDSNATLKQKDELKKRTDLLKAELKNKETQSKSFVKLIQDAKDDEKKAGIEARINETLSTVASFIPDWGRASEKTGQLSQEAREREAEARKTRRKLQEQERDNNAVIAEAVEKLKNSKFEDNELEKAINSLEITVNSMGKIKTVFLNAKQFWVGVQKHCEELKDTDILESFADDDTKAEFLDEIKTSGLGWMALGKVNLEAAIAMKSVDKNIDDIMCNLPNKKEADEMIQNLSTELLTSLKSENEQIQKLIDNNITTTTTTTTTTM